MSLPPIKMMLDTFQLSVLPAAGGAAIVMSLFLLGGKRFAALGSAVAVVFGFVWSNFKLSNLNPSDPITWENSSRLLPWKPVGTAAGWQWVALAALVLLVVGLVSRWVGLLATRYLPERNAWGAHLLVWAPRIAAVAVVGYWLTLGKAAEAWPGLWPITSAVMFCIWVSLDGVARNEAGAEVTAYLAAALFATAAVLIHAHYARAMEIAMVIGSSCMGIAIVARLSRSDASGAIPAAVAFIPGLLLAGRPSLPDHNIPAASFWLIALAPLALAPFLIPALIRKDVWYLRAARGVLILVLFATAVGLAAQNETLAFDEQW